MVDGPHLGRPIWLVAADEAEKVLHTHAGGREIHVLPSYQFPSVELCQDAGIKASPVVDMIKCREFVPPALLWQIHEIFPTSLGVQVLICGWLIVLFPSKEAMECCWRDGVVDEVGGLRVGYSVAEYRYTPEIIEAGRSISDRAEDYTRVASVGLRLRFRDRREGITTVTHAFVSTASSTMSPLRKIAIEWILLAKQRLCFLLPFWAESSTPGMIESRRHGNSPLGKDVWLTGTGEKVCTMILHMPVSSDNRNSSVVLDWPDHGDIR